MIWLRFGYGLVTFWLRFGYEKAFWLRFGYGLVTFWLRFGYAWPVPGTFWLRQLLVTNEPETLRFPTEHDFGYVLVTCTGLQHNHIIWLRLLGWALVGRALVNPPWALARRIGPGRPHDQGHDRRRHCDWIWFWLSQLHDDPRSLRHKRLGCKAAMQFSTPLPNKFWICYKVFRFDFGIFNIALCAVPWLCHEEYVYIYIYTRIKRELRARRGLRNDTMGLYHGIILRSYITG